MVIRGHTIRTDLTTGMWALQSAQEVGTWSTLGPKAQPTASILYYQKMEQLVILEAARIIMLILWSPHIRVY